MAVDAVFGSQTAWVSDIDSGALKIIDHRFPGIPNLGDITKIDWSKVPPVDIFEGGSPCQSLSTAGRREGMAEGTRSNLWVSMREGIAQLKPTYVIWENVRGAFSTKASSNLGWTEGLLDSRAEHEKPAQEKDHALRALGRVLGDLSDLGYDCQWRGLRAADVGAPHGRFRVFVLAVRRDALLNTRHDARGSQQRHERQTHDGAGQSGARTDGIKLLPTPNAYDAHKGGSQHPDKRRAGGHQPSIIDVAEHLLPPTPKASDGVFDLPRTSNRPPEKSTHLATRLHFTDFGDYTPAIERWESVLGRLAPAPTVPTGRNGRMRLSPLFTEWMMGIPTGWVTDVPGITRAEALRAHGNGVVPQQAYVAIVDMLHTFEAMGMVTALHPRLNCPASFAA